MGIAYLFTIAVGCLVFQGDLPACVTEHATPPDSAIREQTEPERTGRSVDVILSAEAAYVWDMSTGTVLYEANADTTRPVASLSKLLSVLTVKNSIPPGSTVEITEDVLRPQRLGANIKLPVGEHATAAQLYAASLIASANDAMVALAVATSGSEEQFVQTANAHAPSIDIHNTKLANATGLSEPGQQQFSTAKDVARMLQLVYEDASLAPYLSQQDGVFTTFEGSRREYDTTNKLLGTYMPILAAKTGYTIEAGENLAIITRGENGKEIGVVILGSENRFQDTKILVEWIWRNYTWT